MIELIDLDTGDTMEVHGDKVSGLQFSGEPTERALRARDAQLAVTKLQMSAYGINVRDADEIDALCNQINEALQLMAEERR
jgi:hypothetical protein